MKIFQPTTGGGGGGGGAFTSITGTATQIAYFDLAGNGTGDSLATRNPSTKNTVIKKAVNANLTQGFEIGTPLLGLNSSLISAVDISTGASGFAGVADLSGFGQSSTTALLAASDGVTTQTASINNGEFRVSVVTTGNTAASQFMAKKTEIDSNFQTSAGLRSRFFGNATEAYMRHQGLTDDLRIGADTGIYLYKNGSKMYFPSSITAPASGYVLTSTGIGTSDWQLPTASLTQDYIGFGNSSNQLTGLSAFKYVNSNNQFLQTVPNNTGNSGATTSPLSFGTPSYSGTGLNDLTLTWNSASYESNKYGGNLSISISSLGTPDKFSWIYTGGYGQVIGSDTDVAILPGLAQELFDTQGRLIAEVTFAAGTGHNTDDDWTATTSLGTYTWGHLLTDGTHNFMYARPVTGNYYGGDAQYLLNLGGNGNRYEIDDASGEWNVFASKMFYVRTPSGGDKAISADLTTLEVKTGDTAGGTTYTAVTPASNKIQDYVESSNRRVIAPSKTLTNSTANDIFEIALPAGAMTGGTITATVIATDGTELQSHSDVVTYAAVNKGGVYTSQITTDSAHDANAVSAGTLAPLWTITTGTDKIIINVDPNSSLTTTSVKIYFQVDNNDGHVLTLI